MNATTVAVDLAKDVFEVARANRAGRIFERKRLTRRQFERFIDELEPGTDVVMEACGTAHYWGRRCQARDVRVRLLPARYVRPYVRRNKTDRADTEALLEADRCGGLQPVPVKTVEQQTLQALHRVRTQWQTARTARINVMRALLREQGLPIGVGARTALTRIPALLDGHDPGVARSPAIPPHAAPRRSAGPRTAPRERRPAAHPSRARASRRPTPATGARRRRAHLDGARGIRWPHPRVSPRSPLCELDRPHAARILHRRSPVFGWHQ